MTAKELIDKLSKLPPETKIFVIKAGGWEYDTWLEECDDLKQHEEHQPFGNPQIEWTLL